MSKEVKGKKVTTNKGAYETLKTLYYSGKVKPSLNKMLVELEKEAENLELSLLACQCLVRTKNFDDLSSLADKIIEFAPSNAEGYYYKGIAIHNKKGKEQEALKNFNEALVIDPENPIYLKNKATTHLSLYKDYHLPIKFAEKHRVKAEENLMKVVSVIEKKEQPTYLDYLTIGDVSILISQTHDAKKYYIKAVNTFEAADEDDKNMNIYKDIIKSQKACIKQMEKFTE